MLTELSLYARALVPALSFAGLCAFGRVRLRLNRFIAPGFAACLILCVLTLAGLAHGLMAGLILLYLGGFAGGIYCYFIQKASPDWKMIALIALFAGFLAWRMRSSSLYIADDFSHWGVAARYLLQYDHLPNGATGHIVFQSYPPGTAVFIYYASRLLGCRESVWLTAQNLLQAILFLPAAGFILDDRKTPADGPIRARRKILIPLLGVIFVLLYKFNRPFASLTVDWLLSFFGFGTAAIILYYRDEPRKALWASLPGIVAVVFVKNSGIFFALACCLLLAWTTAGTRGKSSALKTLALSCAAAAAAYLAWNLYVKISYPAGFESKHAVSLSAYLQNLHKKDFILCLSIAWKMARKWLIPEFYQVFCAAFMILAFVSVAVITRRNPELRAYRRPIFKYLGFCVGCYAVWFIMLYAMYLFSMPYGEARRLASFSRYDSTGLLFMTGLALLVILKFDFLVEWRRPRAGKAVCAGLAAILLCTAPMLSLGSEFADHLYYFYPDLFTSRIEGSEYRAFIQEVRERLDLQPRNYLIYLGGSEHRSLASCCYIVKYELDSPGAIYVSDSNDGRDTPWWLGNTRSNAYFATAEELLDSCLAQYDAVLLLEENPEMESALDAYLKSSGNSLPVYRAYS